MRRSVAAWLGKFVADGLSCCCNEEKVNLVDYYSPASSSRSLSSFFMLISIRFYVSEYSTPLENWIMTTSRNDELCDGGSSLGQVRILCLIPHLTLTCLDVTACGAWFNQREPDMLILIFNRYQSRGAMLFNFQFYPEIE